MAAWVLRTVSALVGAGLLVVLVGTFLPRLPVAGFLGSFVTGQYPLHVGLAAVLGLGLGGATWAVGARGTGVATIVVAVASVAGMLVVLGSLASTARAKGVRLDWTSALTVTGQPDGRPDRTVEYTPGRSLDVYLPPGPGPHPVVVWLHGGSWVRGERTDRTALNRWLADRGHAVLSVQYRLPPPAPVGEDQRRDVACAVSWARAHAGELGLDGGRIVLAGQSAGATLALTTASGLTDGSLRCPGDTPPAGPASTVVSGAPTTTGAGVPAAGSGTTTTPGPGVPAADPGPPAGPGTTRRPEVSPARSGSPGVVAGVVAYYPPVDLRLIAPALQDALFGGPAEQHPDLLRTLSPVDHVRPGLPPTLLLLGSADHFVYPEQVVGYDRRLRAAGVPGRLLVVPHADHVFDFPFGSPGAQITRPAVARFLDDLGP